MTSKEAYTDAERALYQRLANLALNDVDVLVVKGRSYGDSWKQRGGIGAFMMLARKWDRIENAVKKRGYDVFKTHEEDARDEGIIDDIRDLRRYLLLIEDHVKRDVYSEMAGSVTTGNISFPPDPNIHVQQNFSIQAAVAAEMTASVEPASEIAILLDGVPPLELLELVEEEDAAIKLSEESHRESIRLEVANDASVFCSFCLSTQHLEAACPTKLNPTLCTGCNMVGHELADCWESRGSRDA